MGIPDRTRCAPEQWASLHDFTRDMPFNAMTSDSAHGDGLTFSGYAAVFNMPTVIDSWDGEFSEVIVPGAFANTLRDNPPVLMFEHGRHPLIGSMPLGVITNAREDAKGLFIEARLTDNWLIQPVRDAVRDGAVSGMSFRFTVPDGGDTWTETKGKMPQRTLTQLDVRELGPVVFPAYEPTTASVRSLLDKVTKTRAATDDNPVTQAQAVDAVLDEIVALVADAKLSDLPPNIQQAIGLIYAAESAIDELLEMMDIYDPDDADSTGTLGRSRRHVKNGQPQLHKFAGRFDTRSTDGGTLVIDNKTRVRDRMLRLKGIVA